MTMVFARIIARYIAGALIAYGFVDAETGQQLAMDPDIAFLVGSALGVLTELVYYVAKRVGWAT